MKFFSRLKKILLALLIFFVFAGSAFFFLLPTQVGKRFNPVLKAPPYQVSAKAETLHKTLLIADLHADSLLWDRDLSARSDWGHVDLPRLREGNVALQAFTIVTKVPRGINIERNDDQTDTIFWLAIAQRWPVASWYSLTARALHQAQKLDAVAAGAQSKFVIIKTAKDLTTYLARRKQEPEITAGFLGIEGAHALDGQLTNLDLLFNAGFRMMAPTHFFDNDIGGSAHGLNKGGLTAKGREMINQMEAKQMIVDLAHASPQVIDDVLAMATRPVIVSHTGVKGTCDNRRNLSDAQVKKIAAKGGLIGIGYWSTAVCGEDAKAIVRAIKYVRNLVGVEHVALGSDYDGAISAPFDTTGLAQITDALMAEGFSEAEIRLIMGENVLTFLQHYLPQ